MAAKTQPLRVLIVDDGDLARQRLEELLAEAPQCTLVGAVGDGDSAIAAIRNLKPDLVFLDIQMPGKSGIDVAVELGPDDMPPTIFVTAHDDFALRAFELAAVDYLLKPFDDDRFEQALSRARKRHELGKLNDIAQPLRELLNRLQNRGVSSQFSGEPSYIERFAVDSSGHTRIVLSADVDYISASGHYVELHSGTKTYLVRESMDALEERLDPTQFFRIHRSIIIQLKVVSGLVRQSGGDYAVKLRDGPQLSVSRSRVDELERRMGLHTRR